MAVGDPNTARDVLAGERSLPWRTPRLRELASVLPAAAERSLVPGTLESLWPWARLRESLWTEILDSAVNQEPGWAELAGACVAVVELLAGRSPEGSAAWPLARSLPGLGDAPECVALGKDWRRTLERVLPSLPGVTDLVESAQAKDAFVRCRRPQIHALLRGAPPARVLIAPRALRSDIAEPEGAEETRSCLGALEPGWRSWCWHLGVTCEGRSAMLAMALRAVAEGGVPALTRLGDVGGTGELDAKGRVLPVAGLAEKVRRFFASYPAGTCFVPADQMTELAGLRPEPTSFMDWRPRRRDPDRLRTDQWRRLVPVESFRHLLAILEVPFEATDLALDVVERARVRGREVVDWRGQSRPVSSLADLPVARREDVLRGRHFRPVGFDDIALAPMGKDQTSIPEPRLVVTGRPGSGKSMVLRQLHYALNGGDEHLRGPSLLLPARRLLNGVGLERALADDLDVPVESTRALLADVELSGATWLLLDGLDELPLLDRRRAVSLVEGWAGPAVIATRGLPEQLPRGAVLEVQDLSSRHAADVLKAEGRKDLAEALTKHRSHHGDDTADPLALLRSELARTPLGVSLLAMVWSGQSSSRQDLLRDAVLHLVRRAGSAGRLSESARRRFERQGLRFLGAAAWRMLSEGRAILVVEDLAAAEREEGLRPSEGDLLHEAVEHGGFVQPVGPGAWEFSHKSFAELAAARFLFQSAGERPWAGPVGSLGEPSADEVVLHLSTLVPNVESLLEDLLAERDRFLSALKVATRVLLETPGGAVSAGIVARVIGARLRLWCAMPEQDLPGGLSGLADVKRAIARHREALSGALEPLLEGCPEPLKRWTTDPERESRRLKEAQDAWWASESRARQQPWPHELSQLGWWLHDQFSPPRRDVRALLRSEDGRKALLERGATELLPQLEPMLEDRELGRLARDLWWEVVPDEVVLSLIPDLHPRYAELDRVLVVVARRGTPGQRREALLRAVLASWGRRSRRLRDFRPGRAERRRCGCAVGAGVGDRCPRGGSVFPFGHREGTPAFLLPGRRTCNRSVESARTP